MMTPGDTCLAPLSQHLYLGTPFHCARPPGPPGNIKRCKARSSPILTTDRAALRLHVARLIPSTSSARVLRARRTFVWVRAFQRTRGAQHNDHPSRTNPIDPNSMVSAAAGSPFAELQSMARRSGRRAEKLRRAFNTSLACCAHLPALSAVRVFRWTRAFRASRGLARRAVRKCCLVSISDGLCLHRAPAWAHPW